MTPKKYKKDYQEMIDGLGFAWEKLRKHPKKDTAGNDNETIRTFSSGYSKRLARLKQDLLENKFKFSPVRRATVEKGREILIHTINERILTISILETIFPRLEEYNSNHDYSRKGKYATEDEEPDFEGTPLAVEKIQKYLKDGYVWVFEADIKKFFDNVPKDRIFRIIKRKVKNKKILELLKQIIYFDVEPSSNPNSKKYPKNIGIAQGSSLSPLFASIYLYEFDMFISKISDVKLIRYVDDFIILCKDEATAKKMHDIVHSKLKSLGLDMYVLGEISDKGAEKTKITLARGFGAKPFDFLGLTFNNTDVDISQKKKDEIEVKIKEIIYGGGTNFLRKTKSVESRLNGYLDHYKKDHYSRTVASLVKIIHFAQAELRSCYYKVYGKITGRDPFHKLTPELIDRVFCFMGIDFADLERKAKQPLSKKK